MSFNKEFFLARARELRFDYLVLEQSDRVNDLAVKRQLAFLQNTIAINMYYAGLF